MLLKSTGSSLRLRAMGSFDMYKTLCRYGQIETYRRFAIFLKHTAGSFASPPLARFRKGPASRYFLKFRSEPLINVTFPNGNQTTKEKLPMTEVLAWLHANHPNLHAAIEVERDWLRLCCDLRGKHHQAVRDSISEFGFRFAKRGHTLPSGTVSFWSHSCTKSIPLKRRGKSTKPSTPDRGAASNLPAIHRQAGGLYARNPTVNGYASAIQNDDKTHPDCVWRASRGMDFLGKTAGQWRTLARAAGQGNTRRAVG